MNSEVAIYTTLIALLGMSWLLWPRRGDGGPSPSRQTRQQAEFARLLAPALLFRTSVEVAHC